MEIIGTHTEVSVDSVAEMIQAAKNIVITPGEYIPLILVGFIRTGFSVISLKFLKAAEYLRKPKLCLGLCKQGFSRTIYVYQGLIFKLSFQSYHEQKS